MPDLLEDLDLDQLAKDVLLRLREESGARFDLISPQPGHEGPSIDADIVFVDRKTGKAVLIEVRGSRLSGDLPLGMIPHVRRIQEAAAPHRVVLFSISPVSEIVRRSLAASGIPVVQADARKDVVPELAAAVEAAVG